MSVGRRFINSLAFATKEGPRFRVASRLIASHEDTDGGRPATAPKEGPLFRGSWPFATVNEDAEGRRPAAERSFSIKEGRLSRGSALFAPAKLDVGGRRLLGARFRLGRPLVKSLKGGPADGFGSSSVSGSGFHPYSILRACEDEPTLERLARS